MPLPCSFSPPPPHQKALERVLNIVPGDRSHAELLATYVDAVLRGKHGNESLDEARIEALLQLSIELFRHVMVGL